MQARVFQKMLALFSCKHKILMQACIFKEIPMNKERDESKVAGGKARAEKLTTEQRKEIARMGASARWDGNVPKATHEGTFDIGDITISAAVLANRKRLLTQATFLRALGRSRSPKCCSNVAVV